ncbi:MAG: ABC transporter permease subunit [Caloramator sp.]|nr:ABC transporter permease subunit [Caloramator sp.]
MEKKKKTMLLSALFMGLGQIYNKQYTKGIAFMLIELIALINIPKFLKALWGLYTLGEVKFHYVNGKAVFDHSIFLMLQGLISVLLLLLLIFLYVYNIKDARDNAEKIEHKKISIHDKIDKMFPFIVLTPGLLSLMFLILLPIIFTVLVAFTNFSAPYHLPPRNLVDWVGFENFKDLFKMDIWSTTLKGTIKWTITWAFLATFTSYFGGLFLAMLINSAEVKLKKFWRSIFILPYAIPGLISMLVMRLMFSGPGIINDIIERIGFPRIDWLTEPINAKIVLVLINLWLGAPYFMALMTSILTNISRDLYESADIDGATGFHKFFHITLPLVFYSTAPMIIMSFAYNFNNFMLIYAVTDGGPVNPEYRYAGHTDLLISWIYKMTLDQQQYHMASVVTILIFLMIAPIVAFTFTRTRSFKEEDLIQ